MFHLHRFKDDQRRALLHVGPHGRLHIQNLARHRCAHIIAARAAFVGPIMQVPSSVSAIKINGERAYKRVRSGEAVELAARPVTVSRFDILAIERVTSDTGFERRAYRPSLDLERVPENRALQEGRHALGR